MYQKSRHVYNIILCFSVLVIGLCLISGCLNIYSGGEHPYSRQAVTDELIRYAPLLLSCGGIILGSFIIDFFDAMPEPLSKKVDYSFRKNAIEKRRDISAADSLTLTKVKREHKLRLIYSAVTLSLCAVGALVFLIYILSPGSFKSDDPNLTVINAMYWLIPLTAVPFGFSVFSAFAKDKSLKREIELIKSLPTKPADNTAPSYQKAFLFIRIALTAIAVLFVLYGIFNGGTSDVLAKAANICTECIGLG